jgi:hypothetical protein
MSQTRLEMLRDQHNAEHRETPTQRAYFVGFCWDAIRQGVPAEILGVVMVFNHNAGKIQPHFHLRFPDGYEYYQSMYYEHYEEREFHPGLDVDFVIITEAQVRAGDIPTGPTR